MVACGVLRKDSRAELLSTELDGGSGLVGRAEDLQDSKTLEAWTGMHKHMHCYILTSSWQKDCVSKHVNRLRIGNS